jgi:acetaldehyde dehydrogenase/alcohol dehydrogenase
VWTFSCPEVIFGENALSHLATLNSQRAFIITDKNMASLGFLDRVQLELRSTGIRSLVYKGVEPEPAVETVYEALKKMADFRPDLVIGLGGGSCLDVAKVAWFLYDRPDRTLEEINPFMSFGSAKSLFAAIPTTAGTGADVTMGAVLTDTARQRKLTVYARELQPLLTIVDPGLVMAMPRQLTADTGMDVISHAVEAFTSPWNNDFSDGLAIQAMRLALANLHDAWAGGDNSQALEHMHNAATLAGLAINSASIALGHALAHSFGALFPLPHGRVVGMLLPYSMEFTANGGDSRYRLMARQLQLAAATEAEGVASMVKIIRDLAKKIDQPVTIADLGITPADFDRALPALVARADDDPQMLTTQRVPNAGQLARIFQFAYDGLSIDF